MTNNSAENSQQSQTQPTPIPKPERPESRYINENFTVVPEGSNSDNENKED